MLRVLFQMSIDAGESMEGECYSCLFSRLDSHTPGKVDVESWERCIDCVLETDKGNWQSKGAGVVIEEEPA